MILQALYELYQRKVNDGSGDLAPAGWERKEIPFILIIDREGKLVDIEDTRDKDEKNRNRAYPFLVPQSVKRAANVAANLLWDSPAYILGYKPDMKPERLQETQAAFRKRITDSFGESPEDEGVAAVLAFLDNAPLEQAQKHDKWQELSDAMPFMTFHLEGDLDHKTVCARPAVKQALATQETQRGENHQCLISGGQHPVARLHPPIKGVAGTQSTGGNIISFNLDAFSSYDKSQGENAPVSIEAADAYTKALNWLLGKDSSQKLQLGDTTVVYWAQKQEPIEDFFGNLYGDDPEKHTQAVKALYGAAGKGVPPLCDVDTNFYVLGLSPNAARISIRFWHTAPIREFAENIQRYFDDSALDAFVGEGKWPRHKQLLAACAPDHKIDRLPPTLSAQLFESVAFGKPYPLKLMHLVLTRVRAEGEVSDYRAAILKACLIRNFKKEITMGLDKECKDVSYRLGRLFAVYDYIKEMESEWKSNRRDKFFSAFCARPKVLLSRLDALAGHDLKKLRRSKPGFAANREKEIREIMQPLQSEELPMLLSVTDQALFVLGYYHQVADRKKTEADSDVAEAV